MYKKLILIVSLVISGIAIHAQTAQAPANSVDSVTLVISGSGATKQDATHAALRNAIEQAYGVFVSAHTEILNDSLVRDEIITIASGNVYSYHELGASVLPNGNHEVTLQATLSAQKLVAYAQSKGASCELVGGANFAASYTANIQLIRLNQQNTIKAFENLQKQLLQIATQSEIVGFRLNVGEPHVRDSYAEVLECDLSIKTEAYWKQGALQFVELMSNTLNALRLTPEQIEQLNRYNMSSYPVRYNTLTRNPRGCEIAITTGQFYADFDLTAFLTAMMNSLLNPYYITDNLNNIYEGNVAYNRAHTTLFESTMVLSNEQLTNEDLGLIAYKNHTITLPLDTLAKITNFELAKYDKKMYDGMRIVVPLAVIQQSKTLSLSESSQYVEKRIFGEANRGEIVAKWSNGVDVKENKNYTKPYNPYNPLAGYIVTKYQEIETHVYIPEEFFYREKVQIELPIPYETLKAHYQKRQLKVSLKQLSSSRTLVSFDPNYFDDSFKLIRYPYPSFVPIYYLEGKTLKYKIFVSSCALFPEWNRKLL